MSELLVVSFWYLVKRSLVTIQPSWESSVKSELLQKNLLTYNL